MKALGRSVVLGLAAPLLFNLPAQAVDYLQCREMLRTKNEMVAIAKEKDKQYLEQYVYPKCPGMESDKSTNPVPRKFETVWNCLINAKTTSTTVGHYYSPEAAKWAKAAEKVTADMRKRQCPYE
jgi:hypothetical protein